MKSKSIKWWVASLSVMGALLGVLPAANAAGTNATCKGKFANPINDICWSCVMPIKFGGGTMMSADQEDNGNSASSGAACACSNPPRAGFKVSFWEPSRRVDVNRAPFCLTSLGVNINPGMDVPRSSRNRQDSQAAQSFYHAHWYIDPTMFWIDAIFDNSCLEQTGFDLTQLSEFDPTWNDSELTFIFNPEVTLFGTTAARAVCAMDCIQSTVGFSVGDMFWCAGCQGNLYPLNGQVQAHIGGVQASSLIMQRITARMHRELLMSAASGDAGLCGYYPQPVMDKTNYKYSMLYPVPQTQKIAGRCCQPYGRSTILWGAGKEFPYEGEDFAYMIYRKRSCCQSVLSANSAT